MDQIRSVIQSLKRKREPKSKDENEACKVLVGEGPNEPCRFLFGKYTNTEERVAAAPARLRRLSAAFQANREAWVEVIIARCEVASLNDGCQWSWSQIIANDGLFCEYYKTAPDRKELKDGYREPVTNEVDPFPGYISHCTSAPDCPVKKEQSSLTTHYLPVRRSTTPTLPPTAAVLPKSTPPPTAAVLPKSTPPICPRPRPHIFRKLYRSK